jgi:hypothetical protein
VAGTDVITFFLLLRGWSLKDVQTLNNKAHNRENVILPHEPAHGSTSWAKKLAVFVPNVLNRRADKSKMPFITNVP